MAWSPCVTAKIRWKSWSASRPNWPRSNSVLLGKTLPDGRVSQVRIVPFYDRTDIIHETIDTLKEALTEEAIVASLIIVLFLLHLRSTVCVLATFPLSVLCFILMYLAGGFERHVARWPGDCHRGCCRHGHHHDRKHLPQNRQCHPGKSHFQNVYEGATEVGGAIITAVSNTIVSFVPVFSSPIKASSSALAFTKTFAIGAAVVLAITVVPFLCYLMFRPITASRRLVHGVAAGLGVLATLVAHAIIFWGYAYRTHVSGWPTAMAIGVMVYFAVVRMSRERFLP